ncbi:MAG: isocitrate lyase/PEP mutase family protein [Nitrospinae bacterium]|nr:isocitrate lyase/PEP mutase family protein [Nitrospinota bacterium]
MNWTPRREKFRALLAGDKCVHPGSVYDPLTARMAEDIGFEVGMFAGSTASLTVLGAPDFILLTMTEFADQALRINRATGMPLMVDADHGYGNALNVKRTVQELETAGVSGLSIEDTVLPQPFGADGAQLSTVEEGVGKMCAALEGRQDPNLVIAGRTSAPRVTSTEDAIARVTAYESAGVDAIFVVGVQSRAQLEAISAAVNLPIILGGSAKEVRGLDYLGSLGVRVALQGHQPIMAAAGAAYSTLKALKDGVEPEDLENVPAGDFMKKYMNDADYRRQIESFLEG